MALAGGLLRDTEKTLATLVAALSVAFIFASLPVYGETLDIPVALDLSGPAARFQAGDTLWNSVHTMPVPGEPDRLVVPTLVLLPPDLASAPQVSVHWHECSPATASSPPPATSTLVELTSGRRLTGLPADQTASSQTLPMQREGAARLLPILLFPQRISPDTGTLVRCSHGLISVTYERLGEPIPETGHTLPNRLLRQVINPTDKGQWYRPRKAQRDGHDYLVVAREAFAEASIQLPLFLAWKKAQGFSPMLVTFEAMTAEMTADGTAMERPEILRGWLQKHYEEEGLNYVLIIGSPNAEKEEAIPMKQCWPAKEWEDPSYNLFDVPTDMYYADLTGNWNPDGDEFWCELEDYMELPEDPPEDSGAGRLDGVDLVPEVLVGRIPHFGKLPNYADSILARTMAYQQGIPEAWHNRVLLPSPQVCFPDGNYVDGSLVSQYLIENSLAKHAYGHTTLGEWDGDLVSAYFGDDRLDMFTMPAYYNQGYGAVFWCAHGNQEVVVRNTWWYDANANNLPEQEECESDHFVNVLFGDAANDTYPSVIFQASCLTADPSYDGNLTHTLLQRVSIANIASTRLTMGLGSGDGWEPSPYSPGGFSLGVYFIHTLTANLKSVAESFHEAQNTLGYGIQPWTFKIRLEFNVYGDPATRLPGCDEAADCDDLDLCNGVETCHNGQCKRGAPLVCEPDIPITQCQEYGCDPVAGCLLRQKENHVDCNDQDPCTLDDFCYDGKCLSGDLKSCPPATSSCWVGYCHPDSGMCMFGPDQNGTACTGEFGPGECTNGDCLPSSPNIDANLADISLLPDAPSVDLSPAADPGDTPGASGCNAGGPGTPPWGLLLLLLGWSILRWPKQPRPGPGSGAFGTRRSWFRP
jgi:hypothetical protein